MTNTLCPKIGAAQWSCTKDECTCHLNERIWTEPKHPGDAVRQQLFSQGDPPTELGDIRIMDYGEGSKRRYRVAMFCPGNCVMLPGDTPKMEADYDHWCSGKDEANAMYDVYVGTARGQGWKEWARA